MEPDETLKSVIAKLEYVRNLPIEEFETGLDEVNLKIIDLRDRMISRFRQEKINQQVYKYLKQINLALSLIFGLEYPLTGFQRNKIEQAVAVLKPLAGMRI